MRESGRMTRDDFIELLNNIKNNIGVGLESRVNVTDDPRELELSFDGDDEINMDELIEALEQNRLSYEENSILDLVQHFMIDGQRTTEKLPNFSLLPNLKTISVTCCGINAYVDCSKNTKLSNLEIDSTIIPILPHYEDRHDLPDICISLQEGAHKRGSIDYQMLIWSLSRYALKYRGLQDKITFSSHLYGDTDETLDEPQIEAFMQARPNVILPYLEILFIPIMETSLKSVENRQPFCELLGIWTASAISKSIDLNLLHKILDFLYVPLKNTNKILDDECTNLQKVLPGMNDILNEFKGTIVKPYPRMTYYFDKIRALNCLVDSKIGIVIARHTKSHEGHRKRARICE